MMLSVPRLAVLGSVLQTPTRDRVERLDDVAIAVDVDGVIEAIEPATSEAGLAMVESAGQVARIPEGMVLLPGLVDLHIHAPQWPQLGTCLDAPLERWLFEHTFPLEARYADPAVAAVVWPQLVTSLLRHGTTTAVYFATNDEAATISLAAECVWRGQRAFVGRVAMDHPDGTPEWYRDANALAGIEATERTINAIRALDAGRDLVRPMITPRFTPACTDDLLGGLGELASEMEVVVQTHCSESNWTHRHALDRFGTSDALALDRFELLRKGSILAHSNHISAVDADLIAERMVGVAHCPLSNAYFADGVFPARRWLQLGVRVGLGTDVAGGASPSLLAQCQHAVTMSRLLESGVDVSRPADERGVPGSRIDIVTAFWMATLGGAEALGLSIGLIAKGRKFDAIVVDASHLWRDDHDDDEVALERIVRLATPADIAETWVNGRRVTAR